MLGVSVSRETLTPNAGYVVGILLRPAAGQAALRTRASGKLCGASGARSLAAGRGAGPADSSPVRGARRR